MKTIKDLKEAIKDLPDDLPILIPGGDHSYAQANFEAKATSAGMRKIGKHHNKEFYTEWYGESAANPGEVEVPVFLIY